MKTNTMLWLGVISLFPEAFQSLQYGITGRALKDQLVSLQIWNPRDFVYDKHQSVDDRPYGGGPGMVIMAEPLQAAIAAAKSAAPSKPLVIYLSPQGRKYDQRAAKTLANCQSAILISGRYEGIDERIIEKEVDEEWSIGDYILTGGELAAMVVIDAAIRLLPGALGDEASATSDAITTGLLKYPQYTRPENFSGSIVPKVLLSGNHRLIEQWRLKHSLGRTWLKRPDLLAKKQLTAEELALLTEFINEWQNNAKI